MRPIQWHLKNNSRVPESLEKNSNSKVPAPPLAMMAKGKQRSHRPTITPNKACSANLYRHIKRRVGHSLKLTHCKRVLVPTRKQAAHKLSGTKSSLSSLEGVPRPLYRQDSTCGNRQHYRSFLHKQGRRHEVGPTVCPSMENLDLVYQTASNSQSPTNSRPAECGSRQTIPTRPDHPNRVVSPSRSLPSFMQQVAPASDRPICHEVQQQVASVYVTSTGSPGHSSRCSQSAMGGSGRILLPTSSHLGQSGGEVAGLPMQQNQSYCSGVAQHALVLGPSDHVQSDPIEPAHPAQSVDTALQSDSPQKSDLNHHAWLLEPQRSRSRASLQWQWQQEFRLFKGDQPDQSMRQSGPFLQNGASLIRWTSGQPL